jgi:hypothetical protein
MIYILLVVVLGRVAAHSVSLATLFGCYELCSRNLMSAAHLYTSSVSSAGYISEEGHSTSMCIIAISGG